MYCDRSLFIGPNKSAEDGCRIIPAPTSRSSTGEDELLSTGPRFLRHSERSGRISRRVGRRSNPAPGLLAGLSWCVMAYLRNLQEFRDIDVRRFATGRARVIPRYM